MAFVITQQCFIPAAPDVVFKAITDFAAYPEWNPWIIDAQGACAVGAKVLVKAKLGGRIGQYQHRILALSAPFYFHWCDEGWFTYLAYGERIRHIEPHRDGSVYRVELRVSGIMAPCVKWLYGKALHQGLALETQALQQRVN